MRIPNQSVGILRSPGAVGHRGTLRQQNFQNLFAEIAARYVQLDSVTLRRQRGECIDGCGRRDCATAEIACKLDCIDFVGGRIMVDRGCQEDCRTEKAECLDDANRCEVRCRFGYDPWVRAIAALR